MKTKGTKPTAKVEGDGQSQTPPSASSKPPTRTLGRARTRTKQRLRTRREKDETEASSSGAFELAANSGACASTLKAVMMAAAVHSIGADMDGPMDMVALPSHLDLGSDLVLDNGTMDMPEPVRSTAAKVRGTATLPIMSGVRTAAGPAGMKAEIVSNGAANNLSDTAAALHRKLTPLIPGDRNDAGVEAVRKKYPGRRPCIGDKVRLLPGRLGRRSLLVVLKPGELAEIMDDSKELMHVPFNIKGPNGKMGFAGLDDVEVVHASSKTGRPAGTDAAYWLSRVDQIHEEAREVTAIAHRSRQEELKTSENCDVDVEAEEEV